MKTYHIFYTANVIYRAIVEAENEDEAIEKGNTADWEERDCEVTDTEVTELASATAHENSQPQDLKDEL